MAFSFSTSHAAGRFVSVKNVVLSPTANVLARRIGIIGTYDPLKTSVVDEVPVLVTSPQDTAAQFGEGSMLHRLHAFNYAGAAGIPTYIIPQAEAGGATAATGTITFTAAAAVAGTMYLYVGGDAVPFVVADADSVTLIGDACEAAVNADPDLPVTAVNAVGVVTFTAKTKGTYGNFVSLEFDLGLGQVSNTSVTAVVVDMATGSGDPDITDALDALGIGDNSNEDNYTAIVHGYGYEKTTVQDVISTYNGTGNGFTGNYAKEVGRPFRSLSGDVTVGSAGLAALIVKGDASQELDRTNGIICVPGSQSHPSEIAAMAMGFMEATNNVLAEQNYVNIALPGIWAGAQGTDRWTSDYDSRDLAVKAGISPTLVVKGVVKIQDVVSFYHPAAVALENNGYLSMRNLSITQNILDAKKVVYGSTRYDGVTVVADKNKVTSAASRAKVVDRDTYVDQEIALATDFAGNAWLYEADYSIGQLNSRPELVVLRGDGRGFQITTPYIYSGESVILDNETQFDVSIAILG